MGNIQGNKIIWSNENLDINNWDFDHHDISRDLSDDIKYELMIEDNYRFLEDERINLNISTEGRILVIADLGLWNGRKSGYKILDRNIKSILYGQHDYQTWYCDRYDVRCKEIHHDGTNHYLYREIRCESKGFLAFLNTIYNQEPFGRKEINKYTKSIRPYIAKVYGW